MKCTSCGTENKEGGLYCVKCGMRLPEQRPDGPGDAKGNMAARLGDAAKGSVEESDKALLSFFDTLGVKGYSPLPHAPEGGRSYGFTLPDDEMGELIVFATIDDTGSTGQLAITLPEVVSNDRVPRMYEALNGCNKEYRWCSFFLSDEEDGRVVVNSDIEWRGRPDATTFMLPFLRLMNILRQTHPTITAALRG